MNDPILLTLATIGAIIFFNTLVSLFGGRVDYRKLARNLIEELEVYGEEQRAKEAEKAAQWISQERDSARPDIVSTDEEFAVAQLDPPSLNNAPTGYYDHGNPKKPRKLHRSKKVARAKK